MKNCTVIYFLFSISIACNSFGQEKNFFSKISLGTEIGAWKPNNLRTTETSFSFNFYKDNLYLGAFLVTPLKSNLFLRVTVGYYKYTENENSDQQKSILLIPILLDIKYVLISGSKISPYVSYGLGTCIGRQNNLKQLPIDNITNEKIGYGINFGTGFDFLLLKHLALGFEFRYHYLKFAKVFAFTDDYSGPKINLSLYYLF